MALDLSTTVWEDAAMTMSAPLSSGDKSTKVSVQRTSIITSKTTVSKGNFGPSPS